MDASDDSSVTFEVLAQSHDGVWRVEGLETSRSDAERHAGRALERADVQAVRVVRNKYDEATGRFLENRMLARDKPKPRTGANGGSELPPAPPCRDWNDLYAPRARRVVAACLSDNLIGWGATGYEFMGDLDLATQVLGTQLCQAAAQRYVLAFARANGETPGACMVRVYALADGAYAALAAASKRPPPSAISTLAEAAALIALGGVAALPGWIWLSRLTRSLDWAAKLARLHAALGPDPEAAALALFDGCVAEILALPPGLLGALGVAPAGPRADRVCSILDALSGVGEGPLPTLLAAGRLPQCREVLLELAAKEVGAATRLARVGDLVGEAKAIQAIGQRLADGDDHPALRRLIGALDSRAAQLVRPEVLGAELGKLATPEARADFVADLCQYARPGLSARLLFMNLETTVDAAVRVMITANPSAVSPAVTEAAMARMASWQKVVVDTPVDRAHGAAQRIDAACAGLMRAHGVLAKLRKGIPDALTRAVRLHTCLRVGAVTEGSATAAVAAAIEEALRDAFAQGNLVDLPPHTARQLLSVVRFVETRRAAQRGGPPDH